MKSKSAESRKAEADASLAVMVQQGILKAREKLIDLTLRNGMLNYKHSETSTRHVRLVDEKLGFLAEALGNGRALEIASLTPVEAIPRDEESDQFRAALKTARNTDPEWLVAEDARRATGGRRFYKDKAAERALRDRVRTRLGMAPWRPVTDTKVRARELGIDPSYDLPLPSASDEPKHTDSKLQTLFFPDRLVPKLTTIHTTARTLQEDAGISALYCALGFLEWYETEDVENPAYAPLVLLPINMEKGIANGEYIFSIAGRDEDETTNAALHEKLKRHHALDLPDFDPEKGVDAYLDQISEVIRNKKRWKIRRWATIGLFSFSRQAMWSDLDPVNWPDESRPEEHTLLRDIYGDAADEGSENLAEQYDVDQPQIERKAPAIVIDADISQLSAVIDVADGKNVVIQGPPGTGKSQAITNIIANAMSQGKSVLFVSEKMAALKVVKDRLDDLNLGLYCLEVHSAKASKAQVFGSIRERMQAPRPRLNSSDLDRAKQSMQEARQRLTEYAALMNSPAGVTGLSIHGILWGDFYRSAKPDDVPSAALEFRFDQPLAIDRYKLSERVGAVRALDKLCESLGAASDPSRQVWRGITNTNLNRFDKPRAIEAVTLWADALAEIDKAISVIRDVTRWGEVKSIAAVKSLVAQLEKIPDPSIGVEHAILPATLEDMRCKSLTRWAENALVASEIIAEIERICLPDALNERLAELDDLHKRAIESNLADRPISAFPDMRIQAKDALEAIFGQVKLLDQVIELIGIAAPSEWTSRAEALLVEFVRLSVALPERLLAYRSSSLMAGNAEDDIDAAKQIASRALSAASRASIEPNGSIAVIPARLRQAATVLKTTGLFGRLFSSEYREARTIWKSLFPLEPKVPGNLASDRLIAAAEFKEAMAALETCFVAKELAGRNWAGLTTPFDALLSVAKWTKSVRDATPTTEYGSKEIRKALLEGDADMLGPFWGLAEEVAESKISETIAARAKHQSSIHKTSSALNEQVRALDFLIQEAQKFRPRGDATIRKLNEAKELVGRLRTAQHAMLKDPDASSVAHRMPGLTDAERAARIQATINYSEEIQTLGLPLEVLKSFLQEQCSARLGEWRSAATVANSACGREESARSVASALLRLDELEWCGSAFEECELPVLSQKVTNAASSPDDLDTQLQLLNLEEEASSLGMKRLLDAWVTAGARYNNLAWAAEAAFYRSAAETLMRDNPILARHNGKSHEQVRERFRELDKEVLVLNRKMVAARLHERTIPPGHRAQSVRDYTDNQMLDHQTGLQKPRIALRRLFTNAGDAIRAYKPCVMMSPMSVAQYLEPGKHAFDLLVVDEASQMRPEDSLGAMLRCSQAVIVGDPEQLPPSDFFVASETHDEEEADDAPEESILELGRRCWHPMRMLEVHYRSKHQSLITYSNREFYGERLLVYPSPVLKDPAYGVTCHKIDGIYEPGQGRNVPEAQAIVAEAVKLMRTQADRSIGIVAVNQAQSDLIERILDELAASDPDVQAYRQKWHDKLEAPFVKNLENVQGDERDIILISTVYGRTADGVFRQNFGPINRAYGHRRLNVLFTRAKRKLSLFTSLDPTQITVEGKQRGVRVLKEYLEYASTGTFQVGRRLGEEPDSDFERWFLDRLERAGYEAHPQVGVARYRVDIGVVHPERAGNYILGVECDGATYHSSRAARDRDRLRQDVLESLNWNIHRVWSTDWYRDPEREFSRLVQKIENLRAVS